jgi:hypothetical protein
MFCSAPTARMREMHAQKRFWCRCSQKKREAGNVVGPVRNRQDCISGAVKFNISDLIEPLKARRTGCFLD